MKMFNMMTIMYLAVGVFLGMQVQKKGGVQPFLDSIKGTKKDKEDSLTKKMNQ